MRLWAGKTGSGNGARRTFAQAIAAARAAGAPEDPRSRGRRIEGASQSGFVMGAARTSLIEGEPDQATVLDHLGVEVATTDEVTAATTRLAGLGLTTLEKNDTTCCHAVQDKVWVHGPGEEPWEVYTVKADAPQATSVRPTASPGPATAERRPPLRETSSPPVADRVLALLPGRPDLGLSGRDARSAAGVQPVGPTWTTGCQPARSPSRDRR